MHLPGCFCNQELCSLLQTSFLDTSNACVSCACHSDSHRSSQLLRTPAGSNFGGILPVPFCLGDINLPSWWWTQSLALLLTHFLSYHLLTEWSGPHAGCSLPEETNGIQSKMKKRNIPLHHRGGKKVMQGFIGEWPFQSLSHRQNDTQQDPSCGRCINI